MAWHKPLPWPAQETAEQRHARLFQPAYNPGERVVVELTGDVGTVVEVRGRDMVLVQCLDDDMHLSTCRVCANRDGVFYHPEIGPACVHPVAGLRLVTKDEERREALRFSRFAWCEPGRFVRFKHGSGTGAYEVLSRRGHLVEFIVVDGQGSRAEAAALDDLVPAAESEGG